MGFLTMLTVCFILWTRWTYLTAQCPVGWFGSNCQYMCHCERNSICGSDGQCSTKCNTGWFGPECQYVDLTTVDGSQISTSVGSSSTSWLTDRDVTTCNEDPSLNSVTVQWDRPYPFTWLRIQAKNTPNLQLNFAFTSSNISYSCVHQLLAIVDSLTVDYRCEINNTIASLRVSGPSLNGLCSLYVSGGRNVALKQSIEQTGTYQESDIFYFSSFAVDGDTNPYFLQNKCTHTTVDSTQSVYPASWALTLDTARVVNRITIYNRADCCSERLESFELESLDSNNHRVWTYKGPVNASLIYELNIPQDIPVKRIVILATKNDTQYHMAILTLCEVFVFGDCELGMWGLECTRPCPAECRYSCKQDTGTCYQCLGYLDPPHCSKAVETPTTTISTTEAPATTTISATETLTTTATSTTETPTTTTTTSKETISISLQMSSFSSQKPTNSVADTMSTTTNTNFHIGNTIETTTKSRGLMLKALSILVSLTLVVFVI